jgi:diketogulonate reductase-like aldo/keto reductase
MRTLTALQLGYGLGTARYKTSADPAFDEELVKTILTAIKAGYYHLDGAEGLFFNMTISIP